MGVRGLTSYINNREDIYFDHVTLKDCTLIVDANSLVPHLYNSSGLMSSSAFGGDYDRLGDVTEKFFKRLLHNNIYPIVVFDGAVEKRKLTTVKSRAKCKVISLQSVTPSNYNSQAFPLLMRKAMRGKLLDMGIVILQSDLEADCEIAALSKLYRAPVLSNDSDYYIFDVMYVPIPSLLYQNSSNSEIQCQMFRMEKFLKHIDLDHSRLILLAVVLGNDYITRSVFSSFLGRIKLEGSRNKSFTQNVIGGVIRWLKSESLASALQKILSCMRLRERQALKRKIIKVMRGYANLTTVLQNYIPNDPKIKPFPHPSGSGPIEDILSKLNLEEEVGLDFDSEDDEQAIASGTQKDESSSSDSISYCSSEVEDRDCENVNAHEVEQIFKASQESECIIPGSPSWLLNRSRKGLVDPDILTILNLKMYFSCPQPEFYEMPYAGELCTPILQFVAGLLLGHDEIQQWCRQHRNKYERKSIETLNETFAVGAFPPVEQLGKLSLDERKEIFGEIMNVDESRLRQVPEEWKLYFIAIIYWLQNDAGNEIKPYHLHALVMMMITLLVVDKRIGFHRQRKTFSKQYGAAISKLTKQRGSMKSSVCTTTQSLTEALKKVTREDCILSFDALLPNFIHDRRSISQQSKNYSIRLVHTYARLQCCLSFTSLLNDTLSHPYMDLKIHNFYNGTFLYNISSNLKKRANVSSYIEYFFMRTPSLLAVYQCIFELFQQWVPMSVTKKSKKKRKPSTTQAVITKNQENIKFDSDSEPFFDKNNRYSILLK